MTLSLHADFFSVLTKFEDSKWEPGLEFYQEHLIRLNELVLKHENRIEGNLFYFHESKELPAIPDVRRIHKRRNFAFTL